MYYTSQSLDFTCFTPINGCFHQLTNIVAKLYNNPDIEFFLYNTSNLIYHSIYHSLT